MFRWVAAGLLLTALALAACGGGSGNRVTGVIVEVDSPSLTELNSFTLHADDGRTLVFRIAPGASRDPQNGFVGGHLRSHILAASKVEITYRTQGDELLAESMKDLF